MKLIEVTAKFKTGYDCLDYIEAMRWPHGEIGCVHCGKAGRQRAKVIVAPVPGVSQLRSGFPECTMHANSFDAFARFL